MTKKGFLKINILSFSSQHFTQKQFFIRISSNNNQLQISSQSLSQPQSIHPIYFPPSDNLIFNVYEKRQIDEKEGYFNLPINKLYQYQQKNHQVNINCVWKQTKQQKIVQGIAGLLKINITYMKNITANIQFVTQQVILDQSIKQDNKQLDLYLQIKTDQVSNQTTIRQNIQSQQIKWSQVLCFKLQNLPFQFQICLKQKNNPDESLGYIKINPYKDDYFYETSQPVLRTYILQTRNAKKCGKLWMKTHFNISFSN